MTISVTPDDEFEPPRSEITVSAPTDSVMTAVAVYRNDSTGRALIRTQPSAGFDERTVYDYEAPYGEAVTYDWTATYIDPDEYSSSFIEDWSAFPTGWAGDTGLGAEVSGALEWFTPSGSADLSRTVTFEWQEIQIASLTLTGNTEVFLELDITGGATDRYIRIWYRSSTQIWVQVTTGVVGLTNPVTSLTFDPDQPITITKTADNSVLVTTSAGSASFFQLYGPVKRVRFETTGADQGLVIGEISAVTAGAAVDIAEESDPVTLDSDRAWLIHPSSVGLSFPLSKSSPTAAGILGVEAVSNASTATLHKILGSRESIAVSTGARAADVTGMTLYTVDADERAALRSLLGGDIPVLFQIPADWAVDFASGFYSIGDVREARPAGRPGTDPWREFTLPMTKVQSPVTDVLESVWTYTHVVLTYPQYSDVKAAYATYADLATDTRL